MINKVILAAVIIFIVGMFVPAKAQQDALKEKSILYAATLAANEMIKKLRDRNIPNIVENSQKLILTNLTHHQERTESEKRVQRFIEEQLKENLEKDFQRLYESFKITHISEEEYKQQIRKKFAVQLDDGRKEFLETQGSTIFTEARKSAVSEQMNQLSLDLSPSESEVDELYKGGWKPASVEAMRKALKLRMIKGEKVLLEEVEQQLDTRIDKIIQHVKEQLDRQWKALNVRHDESLVTVTQLNKAWESQLEKVIGEMMAKKASWQTFYGIFPSVKEEIEKKAKTEEQERFRRFCQTIDIEIANEKDIRRIVLRDIRRHKSFNESLEIVVAHFLDDASKAIIEEYAQKAPDSERANFKKRLKTRHLSKVKDDIRIRAGQLLKPKLELVRNAIADDQLQQFFSVLAYKSWVLTGDNEIIIKRIKVDQNLSTHAFADYMRQPLKASITTKPFKKNELLVETEQKVVEMANFLIEEAKMAWNGQWNIYLAHQQYIEDAANKKRINLADTIENPPADADKNWGTDKWVDYFIKRIEKIWQDNRIYLIWQGKEPTYREKKYVELFKHIRDEIAQRLKTDIGKNITSIMEKPVTPPEVPGQSSGGPKPPPFTNTGGGKGTDNGQGSGGTGPKSGGTGQGSGGTGLGSGGTGLEGGGTGSGGAEQGNWWWINLLSLLKFLLFVLILTFILAVLMYLLGSKYPPDSLKNIFISFFWLFFIMAIIAGFYQWWVRQSVMNNIANDFVTRYQGQEGNNYIYESDKYRITITPGEGEFSSPEQIQIEVKEK